MSPPGRQNPVYPTSSPPTAHPWHLFPFPPTRAPPGGSTGPGRREGGGAGSPPVRPKSQPTCVQSSWPGPPAQWYSRRNIHLQTEAWRPVSRYDYAQGPRSAGRGGGQLRHRPPGPPRPLPAQTPPRGKAAQIKARGPPARPQTGPGTSYKASRVGSLGTVGHRTGHARSCEPRLRRLLLREGTLEVARPELQRHRAHTAKEPPPPGPSPCRASSRPPHIPSHSRRSLYRRPQPGVRPEKPARSTPERLSDSLLLISLPPLGSSGSRVPPPPPAPKRREKGTRIRGVPAPAPWTRRGLAGREEEGLLCLSGGGLRQGGDGGVASPQAAPQGFTQS
ncbi:formin-like protein 14 [Ictidomys tridecemlineatus]|nr:formin-like protein 14 [Ictidomys tridecemlineatus]